MRDSRRQVMTWSAMLAVCLVVGGGVKAQRDQRGGEQGGIGGVGVTIFAEPNFRGINTYFTRDTPDLRRVNMNDRVDSLRIARGELWEVCENINYKGRCQVFSGDTPDLAAVGWGGMISSLRKVSDSRRRGGDNFPPPPQPTFRPRIVLFDRVGFSGRSVSFTDSASTLGSWGNRTGSIKIYGGTWEICDGLRFRGHCETVSDNVVDLARIGMRDKVSSARPVGRR